MCGGCTSLRRGCYSAVLGCALTLAAAFAATVAYAAFDHNHAKLDNLLGQHVVWIDDGHASQVDYAAIKRDPSLLRDYLSEVAAVTSEEYRGFTKSQQLAFLINAYNAYTIDFVLTKYPDIESIKELGSLFNRPWRKRLFPLLGEKRSLDEIEHGMIRKPGDFDEPRIHMAVNCAAVGCPALRDEAYIAEQLDMQLEDSVRRFLSDSSRNRADEKFLSVSKIFDWYADDFKQQAGSVARWLAPYAEQLSSDARVKAAVANASLRVRYLRYDWALNDRQIPG
ncbi:MAG: DUF547 domain-containing protein [Betaproteobacteria bacterium]|nr:MAG: DUF547 domain-containing protein [Betaproteobacteria bacterium]